MEEGWAPDQPGAFGVRRSLDDARGIVAGEGVPASAAWNLLCHGDEAAAFVVRCDGEVVQRWAYPYGLLPRAPQLEEPDQNPWQRAVITPDGGLIAVHRGRAIVSLDEHSRLRWFSFVRAHDGLALNDDGTIVYALVTEPRQIELDGAQASILDERIVGFDANGEEVTSMSLWEALASSEFVAALGNAQGVEGNVLDVTSLKRLTEETSAAFGSPDVRGGQFLVTLRARKAIAVVDVDGERIAWWNDGPPWNDPSDASAASDGRVLVLDHGLDGSQVLALSLEDGATARIWPTDAGESFDASLHASLGGSIQALANGHIVICEASQGRAMEVDPSSGAVVWSYASDRFAGEDDELVAALLQFVRL